MTERVFAGDRSLAEAALATVERMKVRLATPEAWTQGGRARNSSGAITLPYKEDAVCWCLLGAIDVEVAQSGVVDPNRLNDLVYVGVLRQGVAVTDGVAFWNDEAGRKHNEVLEAISRTKAHFEAVVADFKLSETA